MPIYNDRKKYEKIYKNGKVIGDNINEHNIYYEKSYIGGLSFYNELKGNSLVLISNANTLGTGPLYNTDVLQSLPIGSNICTDGVNETFKATQYYYNYNAFRISNSNIGSQDYSLYPLRDFTAYVQVYFIKKYWLNYANASIEYYIVEDGVNLISKSDINETFNNIDIINFKKGKKYEFKLFTNKEFNDNLFWLIDFNFFIDEKKVLVDNIMGTGTDINYYKNQTLTLPVTLQTFTDSYGHTLTWNRFTVDSNFLTPQFDGGNDYYFDCLVDFKADVDVAFLKKNDDNTNPQLTYSIFENSIEIFSITSSSSAERFEYLKNIHFRVGNYYEFTVNATGGTGGGFHIKDLAFNIVMHTTH